MFKWYKKVFFSINQTTLVFLGDMMAMWLTDNNLPGYYVGKMVPWSYFLFHFLIITHNLYLTDAGLTIG